MRDRRNRVLPQLRLLGNQRTQIARDWPHIAVRQLEPRLGEGIRELLRVLVEAPRDLLVGWIEPQRQVRRQHRRRDLPRLVMRVRNRAFAGAVLRLPLLRARRTRGRLPPVLEKVLEVIVAPPGRRRGPGDLEAARGGVGAHTGFVAALPTETLFLEIAALRFGADACRRARPMGLAERVSAGNQRDRLL